MERLACGEGRARLMSALDLDRLCTIPDRRTPLRSARRLAWVLRPSMHDSLSTFPQHVAVQYIESGSSGISMVDFSLHVRDIELVRSPNPKQVCP